MTLRFGKAFPIKAALVAVLCCCLLFPPVFAHAQEGQASISCGFSRDAKALELILDLIGNARATILVAAYSFTSKPIAVELINANKRGVKVFVVADDKANRDKYTAVTFLANQGVPVRLNDCYAIMHHKFMVVDGKHVQTGSFNYTRAADQNNAENVVVLRDVTEIASMYANEWETLWNESKKFVSTAKKVIGR